MTDWGASGRRDTYRATLVDKDTLQDVAELPFEPSESSLDYGYYTDNLYSGSIRILGRLDNPMAHLVRVYRRTQVDGYDGEEAIATMFVESDPTEALYGAEDSTLKCYSTLYRYTKSELLYDFGCSAGESIFGRIRRLVELKYGSGVMFADGVSDRSLQQPHVLEAGTNAMTALSTMAGWVNASVTTDGWGNVIVEPYVEPADRPTAHAFTALNSTYAPGATYEDGGDGVCNTAKVSYSNSEGSGLYVARLDAGSPYSVEVIGREVLASSQLSDRAYTQDELKKLAERLLAENSGATVTYEIEHVGIPGLRMGDGVTYENDHDFAGSVFSKCVITESSMELGAGNWTKSKLKVVGR